MYSIGVDVLGTSQLLYGCWFGCLQDGANGRWPCLIRMPPPPFACVDKPDNDLGDDSAKALVPTLTFSAVGRGGIHID